MPRPRPVALSPDEIVELDRIFSLEHVVGERYPSAGMVGLEA